MQEVYFMEFRMKLYVQLMILFVISLAGQYDHSLFAASSGNHGKV